MPAQSPTLSPTLSAIVAGLRGSSSGMPASTLPTRSAPTSAALVKMPPPTRRNSASNEPPKPKPMRIAVLVFWKTMMISVAPSRPRPTVNMPATPPVRKATVRALGMLPVERGGRRADVATGRERHADVAGEAGGDAAEHEGDGAPEAGLPEDQGRRLVGLDDLGRREEHDQRQRDEDHGDRAELALEVGEGALLDRQGDLAHLGCPLVLGEDGSGEEHAHAEGQQRRGDRQPQDGPLAALQYEVLPATFGSEQR